MRIYVAGKMTGLEGHNLPAFADATERLTAAGFDAVNPGRHGVYPGYTWSDYMRKGLTDMLTCAAVAVLPGWSGSAGANLEVNVAKALDIKVHPLDWWLRQPDEAAS